MTRHFDLKERDEPRADNEPSVGMHPVGRDGIRNMVRACLLRGRDINTVHRQVIRDFGYGEDVATLTEHFYKFEVATPSLNSLAHLI